MLYLNAGANNGGRRTDNDGKLYQHKIVAHSIGIRTNEIV